VEDILSLLGQFLLTGEGAMLTRYAVASAHTIAAHASALLQQIIITVCSYARRRDVTTRRPSESTVMRRAASVTGGLTVVSAYLPDVSVDSTRLDPGTRTPPTRIKCGSWAGVPQKAGCHRTRGRAGLAAATSGARGGIGPPPRREGRSGSPRPTQGAQAPWGSGHHTWRHRTTPRWFGPVVAAPEHPIHVGSHRRWSC
jgi:hypothetical protein